MKATGTRYTIGRSLFLILTLAGGSLPVITAGAASHDQIAGSGSSWAANAVDQWDADVQANGLRVVFTASGSATGRQDFANSTNDFAVSDIGYQGFDPLTRAADQSSRPYAYLPIVAGGTSFPYQVRSHGQLVRNLRLSGKTLAKIFTNQISNWNDAQITADNNGRQLPDLPIIPVVHSEGSGATAQFTKFLAQQYGSIWGPFAGSDVFTEYYPRKDPAISQNGADGVINFITSAAGNGAIGYDEYSYALGKNYPVAGIKNAAGYYVLPDQYNVAVALTQAKINQDKASPDYLLQDLSSVYIYNDPRTYPLSSYSYGIIPTSPTDPKMTSAKRQTLADYLFFSVCTGQKEMGPIGYSPLPINLVQASFDQVAKLKAADPAVDLTSRDVSSCNNPTFVAGNPSQNHLADIAPQPPACDQTGAGPCGEVAPNLTTTPSPAPTQSDLQAPASISPQGGPGAGSSGGGGVAAAPDGSSASPTSNGTAGTSGGGGNSGGSAGPSATSGPRSNGPSGGPSSGPVNPGGGPPNNSAGGPVIQALGAAPPTVADAGGPADSAPIESTASATETLNAPINPSDVPLASIPYRLAGGKVVLIPVAVLLLALALAQPSLLIGLFRRRPKGTS